MKRFAVKKQNKKKKKKRKDDAEATYEHETRRHSIVIRPWACLPDGESDFRLRTKASGLEIVKSGNLSGHPPTTKPTGKGGALRPPLFPLGNAVGVGRLDSQSQAILGSACGFLSVSTLRSSSLRLVDG